ncbi:hypothetical protein T492DRAFT_1124445 [Pavlovales sp. CCMP2436]|nr:hypothetical protein T492DRAFT_1124445 [Pavlovales sp. CCMP2436]
MANVYGRLSSDPPMTPLEVPLLTSTSTETRLNLSGFTTAQNQNQTRDPRKTLVIRNPTSSTAANLVLPFNQSLYGSPLAFVADLALSNELATTQHKSLGVQFSFLQAKPIAAGSIFTLGDTLKLQAETVTDPKLSTYTMNLLLPVASCGSFFVNRNIGTDPSKNSLGLLPTNNAFNPSWGSNMAPIPFENVAQVAYFRGGVKKDGRNRIEAELLVTGSSYTVVDTFSTSAWVDNVPQTFIMHNQTAFYKFWRITVTRVTSTGSSTYAILPDIIFDTGIGITRFMYSLPMSISSFKFT